ncbi:1-acyl-sn-glycerol-3-phosphate acyltransferase [Aeromicrobium sp. A1-2]|uniref:lysophospholipid acyltransferase family protein n=1 Tax=Aeromicrobium sp. A1-2 TaxID=2107713 RepID=UPI000E4B8342|nr:lysophospholipid acyltransferase family protein [Aeromicrobium sp. A1-2]AXT85257.1 1-acyl-sn-glycerol-3-phosphate acyltransferase [Aeromicrobium sp. A1-2]
MTAATGLPEGGLRLMRRLVRPYFTRRWDIRIHGADHVPTSGPVILASNHIGWLDGPLLFVTSSRPAHALVKEEEFVGRTGRLLRFVGQIKVSRTRTDAGAVRRAVEVLAAGQAVLIYPEATRGAGDFARFKGGVAYLALVSGAPVVPVAIIGTRLPGEATEARPAKGARLDVSYGTPIRLPMQVWPRDRGMMADAGDQIHDHLRAHVSRSMAVLKRELPGPLPTGSFDG